MRFQIYKTSNQTDSPHQQAIFDADNQVWSIEIDNISTILRIAHSNDSFNPGEIVLSYGNELKGYVGNIEIYDDCREQE